jgi:hypothetical protein
MKHSFEYCALRYLLVWETAERELHDLMTNQPSPLALRKSMQHFRIARSFKGVAEESNATFILNAVAGVSHQRISSPCETVMSLASQFQKHFGKFNLSAASKLLWLTFRTPYIIYDTRTVAALRSLGCEFDNKDYTRYYGAWHSSYDQHKLEIERAAERLTTLEPFFTTWHDSEDSLRAVTSQLWFHERVFDNYLWEMGDDAQQRLAADAAIAFSS